MTYTDFFSQIRSNLKDADTDATARISGSELGRAIWNGVRKIQSLFPESRLDTRGYLKKVETASYTDTTAAIPVNGELPEVPLPVEFEPILEAYVMEWAHGRDAQDSKDLDLSRHWRNRFDMLTGNG